MNILHVQYLFLESPRGLTVVFRKAPGSKTPGLNGTPHYHPSQIIYNLIYHWHKLSHFFCFLVQLWRNWPGDISPETELMAPVAMVCLLQNKQILISFVWSGISLVWFWSILQQINTTYSAKATFEGVNYMEGNSGMQHVSINVNCC